MTKKQIHAKNMRYKKPMVKAINHQAIVDEMYEMLEECEDVRWYADDVENLTAALEGDEDEAYEFRMMFSDLCAELEAFQTDMNDNEVPECFDDWFVSIGGANVGDGLLGYDSYEHDYFGIERWEYDLAEEEAKKRMLRKTKEEILENAGTCFRILMAYIGIRYRYDCLKASLDILTEKNTGHINMVKQIEETYEKAAETGFASYEKETKNLERLAKALPADVWIS